MHDASCADAFHQVAVASRCANMRWSTTACAEARSARELRSASAKPTALPTPWPSGPVVVSTPGVWRISGWPGVLRAPLPELLELVEREVVAGEVQHRVEEHRRVARGEHEAVAVRPLRVVGS